jgi:hypothetical protein
MGSFKKCLYFEIEHVSNQNPQKLAEVQQYKDVANKKK